MSDHKVRVLHFSSRYEQCGIAKYLDQHIQGMHDAPGIENDYFEVSPYDTYNMKESDLKRLANDLAAKLKDYDVLHVQHEFALYAHDSFLRIVQAGKKAGKKVVVTSHISPLLHGASRPPKLRGLGPRSFLLYLRELRHHRHFMNINATPFQMADLILAHNDGTIEGLRSIGVREDQIKKMPHPVYYVGTPSKSTRVANELKKKDGDIVFATIGFIHKYKGILEAVKALKFLPPNYKLAVLGGMKADSDDTIYYDKVCDLIDALGLRDRVYIAGIVPSDEELNALIQEVDVCVYPYNGKYYAQVSSGSINLAIANGRPVIAYPTTSIKELASEADGAVVLCETFAYYELARELKRIDLKKQAHASKEFAEKMAWPKISKDLALVYKELARG